MLHRDEWQECIMQRKAITGELESAKYMLQKESEKVIRELKTVSEKKVALEKWRKNRKSHTTPHQ